VTEPRIEDWPDPPAIDAGSPEPAVYENGGTAWVAYRCHNADFPEPGSGASANHPGFDEYCAVLRFTGVESLTLGPPGDERLYEHPLHDAGLEPSSFHVVEDSDEATEGETAHWIVSFHDETLEVIAEDADVFEARVDVSTPEQALSQIGK
jgi:hypothetical protein